MAAYSIGEVETITGIKAYILRYWEEVIPGFAPRKDSGGHRVYSRRDVERLMRMKYLIQERKFTIEGARSELISEADVYAAARNETSAALEAVSSLRESTRSFRNGQLPVREQAYRPSLQRRGREDMSFLM